MQSDWKDWVLQLFQPLDSKVTELAKTQSEHKMALKILGITIVVFMTGLITFGFGLVATAFKVWGHFG